MKTTSLLITFLLFSLVTFGQTDKPACKDAEPSYLGRMKGFYIAKTNKSLKQIWKTPESTK